MTDAFIQVGVVLFSGGLLFALMNGHGPMP